MSSFYFWHWRICVLMRLNKGALCICDGLVSIYYNGTIAQWKAIIKGKSWNDYTWNYTVHCTDGDIENEGR